MEIGSTKAQTFWDNMKEIHTSFYTRPAIEFAERWANEMEKLMKKGTSLKDACQKAFELADTEKVTGYQSYFARQILIRAWRHGSELESL